MLCGFLRMFLLRLVSIWFLIHIVDPAPQWLNSRFGRRVIQLGGSNSTSPEFDSSVAKNQEQNANRQTFPRLILFQDLQPPNFGILNKLPYLTLQPPLFALPQDLTDDVLIPLPGPASNSVDLEKRSRDYAQENNSDRLKGTQVDSKAVDVVNFGNNTVLPQIELTKFNNSETTNDDSTASLDLPPTTEVTRDDLSSSAVIASRQGKESDETTINTEIINEIRTTFNDETTNTIPSTRSETNDFDDVETTSTSVLDSTTDDYQKEFESGRNTNAKLDFNAEQIQEIGGLDFGQTTATSEALTTDQNFERKTELTELINSRHGTTSADEYTSEIQEIGGLDFGQTTASEALTTNQNFERKTELTEVINSRHGTTSADELTTLTTRTANDRVDVQSTTEDDDALSRSYTSPVNGDVESIELTTSLTTTAQTEFSAADVSTDQYNIKRVDLTEVANINSRYGTYETTTTYNGLETESSFSADSVVESGTEGGLALTEPNNTRYTALKVGEETTLANALEDFVSTTENQESSTSQVNLNNDCTTVPKDLSDSEEAETFKPVSSETTCVHDYVTDDVGLDEPSDSAQNVELTTVSTGDLKLRNRIFITEEVEKGTESEVRTSNLEFSTENPSTTEVFTSDQNDEQVTGTTVKEEKSTELTSRYEQNEATTEELLIVTTPTSDDEVVKSIAEDYSISNIDTSTSSVIQASNNAQELESRINNEEEVTVSNGKLNEITSPNLLPPLASIKSDVSVSYGLNYKPDTNDITYVISTTVKSILLKSEGDGNVTSEVNATVNATSASQDQNNVPGFSTSVAGSVSTTSQGPGTEVADDSAQEGFGIELNKTNDAPEINIRLLPPFQSNSVSNGLHDRLSDPELSTANAFDFNQGSNGFGRNTFTIPPNTHFTVRLNKPGAPPNFSLRSNEASETGVQENAFDQKVLGSSSSDSGSIRGFVGASKIPGGSQFSIKLDKSGAQSNYLVQFNHAPKTSVQTHDDGRNALRSSFYNSGSVTEDLGGSRNGKQRTDHNTLISPSSSVEVGRSTNFPPGLSVEFSGTPNINVFGRQNLPQDTSGDSASVKGSLPSSSKAASNSGVNIQEQINFSSVINIGNQSQKSVKGNTVSHAKFSPDEKDSGGPSKFRSVTIDTSEPNDPSELLRNYNKNGQTPSNLSSPPEGQVEAKYLGKTYVEAQVKPETSTVDGKAKGGFDVDDSFKTKFGFDLGFLSRGIKSKPLRELPPRTESPQNHLSKPIRPTAFNRGGGGSSKSGTFGVSLGPYRDTIIKHTNKGWSLRTYDKLILHTGLSGQYL